MFQKDRMHLVMKEILRLGIKEVYSLGDIDSPLPMRVKTISDFGLNDNLKIITVDKYGNPDIRCDLNGKWNFKNCECIFAGEVIEHVLNPTEFIQKCHGALNSGGHLILTTPNWGFYLWRLQSLMGAVPEIIRYDKLHGNTRHYNAFSVGDIERLLADNHFRILRFVKIWKIPAPLSWQPTTMVVAKKE